MIIVAICSRILISLGSHICKGRWLQAGMIGLNSDNLVLMGTMHPNVKHRTKVLVIANTSLYQLIICVPRGLKTNLLHLHMENLWEGISM